MMRQTVLLFGAALALCAPALAASAVELPIRKAGLWELKMVRAGSPAPEMMMQQCTDESTDKQMSANFSPMAKQNCSKNDTQQTATGYVTDSVCTISGTTMTSHAEITGDFNSAYAMKVTSHNDKPMAGVPADTSVTLQAKWIGPCAAEQRPGDIVMPGGFRMNIKDMEKLKGLLPK
jgi:phage tail sheath gpL-like